jgi:hypothetical protein
MLDNFKTRLAAAMEGVIADDQMEREYVFFGKMVDPSELHKAEYFEDQEQYRILSKGKTEGRETSLRIRKTVKCRRHDCGDIERKDPIYQWCLKSYVKGEPGNIEAEGELAPLVGEAMLKVFRTEGDGMIKRRFCFGITGSDKTFPEGTFWEVDAFFVSPPTVKNHERIEDMDYYPYVKIDLEVKQFDLKVTSTSFELPFPIQLTEVVYEQPHNRSKVEAAKVAKMMKGMVTS